MVNEPGFAEAVRLAREHPRLGVGLHLTLLMGHSALPPEEIPGLVNARGEFSNRPVRAGLDYFFQRSLRAQLRAEIRAQFDKFRATGLPARPRQRPSASASAPGDPRISDGSGGRIRHPAPAPDARFAGAQRAAVARPLALPPVTRGHLRMAFPPGAGAAPPARHPPRRTAPLACCKTRGWTKPMFWNCCPTLPPGDSELYSHPSLDNFRAEFEALISPRVRETVRRLDLALIRYQDL